MWSEEVIVRDKERGKSHSAVKRVEAVSWSDMKFIGSV